MNGNQGSSPPSATLANVTFQANQARGGDGVEAGGYALGGGMFAFGYAVSGDGLVFTDNAATAGSSDGDGLFGTHKADALGGAVAASVDSIFDLRHVQASGNVATGGDAPNGDGGCAYGGALFAELATFALSDATIVGNRAAGGDGRNAGGPSSFAQGGGVMATLTRFTLDRVTVRGNEARAGDGSVHGGLPEGGAVAVTVGARDGVELPFTIRNSVLANNLVSVGSGRLAGGGGGALWIQGASGTVEHVTIADNRLGEPHLLGGGVGILPLAGVQTRVAFVNDIFANHRSPAPNPSLHTNAALWVAQDAVADVTHALFANNIHDTNAGIWDPNYVPAGTINLIDIHTAANAGFVSAGDPQNDYHLLGTSPAVDRASAGAVTIDLDGTLRPAGLAPDLGAYELTP
jgi:hypothetical protein